MALLDTSSELQTTVARLNARTHIATVSGELDLHNADDLRSTLWPLADAPRSTVVADLCGVTFIDSTALGVLTGLAKRLRAGGGDLVVASSDPRLRRLLEITGLLAVLHCESSLAEAVNRVVDAPAV